MKFVQDIIIRPLITERSMDGVAEKKFSFEVAKNATKPEIAAAVEAMFKGTKVKSVNTLRTEGKIKRQGMHAGRTPEVKKAHEAQDQKSSLRSR